MSGYSVFLCELLSVVIVVKRLGGKERGGGGEVRGGGKAQFCKLWSSLLLKDRSSVTSYTSNIPIAPL